MEGKFERHRVFEAEVLANEPRISECHGVSVQLVESGHYAAEDIQKDSDVMEEEWEELLRLCGNRSKK